MPPLSLATPAATSWDFFKQFNDTYGHSAGDRCIMMVAATLNRAVRRAADLATRYGGDEFACVLPGANHEDAMLVAHQIRDQVRALGIPHMQSEALSVGCATAPCLPDSDPMSWVQAADAQLYLAKASGRDGVAGRVFKPRELQTT